MSVDIYSYATLIFDCDGVILDSNRVKTLAFYKAASPYGDRIASALVDYHRQNGGVSRFEKFRYLLDHLVTPGTPGPDLQTLLMDYAGEVRGGLLTCPVAPGLRELRARTGDARWLIVSGGAQDELREVFAARGLSELFDGGIYGSPDDKQTILAREIASGNITQSALFLGDSRYDHTAASAHDVSFVFVADWSEFEGWRRYCQTNGLPTVGAIADLVR